MKSAYLEEVRKEARKEGRKEGRKERLVEALLKFLRSRFPGQYPTEWETRIQQTRNGDSLNRWLDAAITAASVDEFRQACGF